MIYKLNQTHQNLMKEMHLQHLIAVKPVPPPVIPITFKVLQAVPSYFQVLPLEVKIWFVEGDVGKSSAINISN